MCALKSYCANVLAIAFALNTLVPFFSFTVFNNLFVISAFFFIDTPIIWFQFKFVPVTSLLMFKKKNDIFCPAKSSVYKFHKKRERDHVEWFKLSDSTYVEKSTLKGECYNFIIFT